MRIDAALGDLLEGFAQLVPEVSELRITDLCDDTRDIKGGEAFLCMPGSAGGDGSAYINAAAAAGARAIIADLSDGGLASALSERPPRGIAVVLVKRFLKALPTIIDRAYPPLPGQMKLIAVTGTNGKSTVVDLLRQLLPSCASLGSNGVIFGESRWPLRLTTPTQTVLKRQLWRLQSMGARYVALEASSIGLAQRRLEGLPIDIGVFTNLSRDHLDYHRDKKRYRSSKFRLFNEFTLEFSVVNIKDDTGQRLADTLGGAPVFSYRLRDELAAEGGSTEPNEITGPTEPQEITGPTEPNEITGPTEPSETTAPTEIDEITEPGGEADYTAQELSFDAQGVEFGWLDLKRRRSERWRSPLLCAHNVENLLAALAVVHSLNQDGDDLSERLARLEPCPGRAQRLELGDGRAVIIDYAHTPEALEGLLGNLPRHGHSRLCLVFGCGGERDKGKRPQMARAAERHAERIIVTDDNPRGEDPGRIIDDILAGFKNPDAAEVIRDRRAAINAALSGDDGHAVVIAGRGNETRQIYADREIELADLDVVREFIASRGGAGGKIGDRP